MTGKIPALPTKLFVVKKAEEIWVQNHEPVS